MITKVAFCLVALEKRAAPISIKSDIGGRNRKTEEVRVKRDKERSKEGGRNMKEK